MDHIGIDVHKKESQICILAALGELLEQRIRTEPKRFANVLGAQPRGRIVLETSTGRESLARCPEALGHKVIVAAPTSRLCCTDRHAENADRQTHARSLTDACVLGAYHPAL